MEMSLPESKVLEPLNKVFTAQRVARLVGLLLQSAVRWLWLKMAFRTFKTLISGSARKSEGRRKDDGVQSDRRWPDHKITMGLQSNELACL